MGPPKQTPSKQGNTLFSYFTKSPSVSKNDATIKDANDVLSPKRSPNQKDKSAKSTPKIATKTTDQLSSEYNLGDLLWSKLEGYPWWPSLVCNHPTENTHVKAGKNPQVHVQFFDEPVSRSWVKVKNVRPFKGSDDEQCQKGGTFFSMNMLVRKAGEEADKAMKMEKEDRLKLVVELLPSDHEEDEDMDFDPDIFDTEMDDEEPNNSKENKDIENSKGTPSKKTPKKSPRKGRSSARQPKHKRRRIIESKNSSDEDSEDEFKPHSDSSSDDEGSSGVDEGDVSDIDPGSEMDSPLKEPTRKRKRPPVKPKKMDIDSSSVTPSVNRSSSFTPNVGDKTKSRLAVFTATDVGPSATGSSEQEANFPHVKLPFLQPGKILDIKGKPDSDPDYDPRTVDIPDSFLKQQTPAMRQWWEMKSKYFDTILFFKMGKFYELFHMDAVIAVNELGIIYMKGEHAHSGFPEIAYNRYAATLIQKGYKVARIEQTETPDMMNERVKNMSRMATKYDKVVKREVCRVTTKGTQTFSFLDGDATEAKSNYLLAVAEKEEGHEGCSTYGVCFVDTSIGKFHVGQFKDDRYSSRLRTLIAHYTPAQVMLERSKSSQKTNQLINSNLVSVIKEFLASGTEFWESGKTLKRLAEEDYFKADDNLVWPETIKNMISDTDSLGLTAADNYDLAVRALGAITWYLQFCLLDNDLLSMKNFEEYTPLNNTELKKSSVFTGKQHMVLDGVTLSNLDVTENSSTGTLEGTLLQRLDQCSTPFGRRLLKQWLCAPLCNPEAINDRLNAVEELMESQDIVAEVIDMMKKIPDLERILNRIHSLGSNKKKNHPDSRAIMFDEAKYSKKKIEEFLSTLEGFKTSYNIALKFKERVKSFKSKLLKKTLTLDGKGEDGIFPDLKEEIIFFENAFDHSKAKRDGVIVPSKGVDPEYDAAKLDIKIAERNLEKYLDKQRDRISCRQMQFWGSGKNRFQMEVPESALKRVPDKYELKSSKKGWKRYWTKDIVNMLAELTEAEDRKDMAQRDCMRRIFESFDERYKTWDTTVQCLAVLDVLVSMSQYSRCGDGVMCRPEVVAIESQKEPYMELREARHPCVVRTFGGGDFIPNDTVIGIADENDMDDDDMEDHSGSKVVLVTGPNMGGKSTLMRQVGLITIIAQMGCYVPAEKCKLTPVDRVFTRLGASDRIMAGESTFYVELSETAAILQHATRHSLVLMDELGRGTATYDGTAIACSVVQELSRNIVCRTLFSTHYHSLVEEFSHDPNIRLGHMACMVENEDEDPSQETITFLYKFTKGACPKSYGFNAAKLANIPDDIIRVAVKKSQEFEKSIENLRMMRCLWNGNNRDSIMNLQNQMRMS